MVDIHFDLFMYPFRTAKSLLLCPDPLRPLQHRRHPAGHSCWCSEWRHHLFPYCCHSVSFSSSAGFWSLMLCVMHKSSACTFSLFFWIDLKSFFLFLFGLDLYFGNDWSHPDNRGWIGTLFYAIFFYCVSSINVMMSVVYIILMRCLLCLLDMSGRIFAHPLKLMWKFTAW